ncbi:polysaccharide pyruvyl transferase family protein [Pseudomonadota bacterium]
MNLLNLPSELYASILDSRTRILREVAEYSDVTFVRLRGNMGDHLIWAGARQLLRTINYREVPAETLGNASGELAVLAGGGGWCEYFHGLAPMTLVELEKRFSKVVVLPSTFDPTYEPVATVLANSNARIYARERVSHEKIRQLCDADLAHDCAFYFNYEPYLRSGSGELRAFREDHESAIAPDEYHDILKDNRDISSTCQSMDEWLWEISRCETVFTDRAHVMIAGALLGKNVRYVKTLYHKLPAIADYAFSGLPVRPLSMG